MLAFWVADVILNRAGQKDLRWQGLFASPLHLAILIFGFIAALATVASITPAISFWGSYFRKEGLFTLICLILFSLIVAQQIRSRAQLLSAIYTLLLSSGIVSLLGILQYFIPDVMVKVFQSQMQMGGRIVSTVGNPLFLSSYLAMVIPFNLALIVHSWSKRREGNNTIILIGLVILLALQFWCLWLAQYSITILLYIIAPIIFVILLGWTKRKKLLLGLGAASLIGLAIIAGLLLVPLLFSAPSTETTVTENFESVPIAEELGLKTLGWRVQFWHSTIDMLLKSPEVPFSNDRLHFLRKVIGYGPETFIVTFQLFFPDKLKSMYTSASQLVDRPHNDYLYLAATTGLLGLMSFLSILAVFFYLCFRYLIRATADIDKLFLIAMVAATAQYMADIFFNISTLLPELVFWLMLAMVPVIGRFIVNEEPAREELEEAKQPEGSAKSHVTSTRFVVSMGCAVVLIIVGLIISIRPFLADIYIKEGLKLQSTVNEQAISAFDRATTLEPGEATYWHFLGMYSDYVARRVTNEPLKTEMLSLAIESYTKSLELNRYIAFDYYFLADAYTYWTWTGTFDKWDTVSFLYDKASQLLPNNAVLLDEWSLALIIKGDLDEARTKLENAESVDPGWAETSFISGLILAKEGKNDEAVLKLIAPIQDDPANLDYFIDLCLRLSIYDMLSPLRDSSEIYVRETPDNWIANALLGTTSFFSDNLDKSLDEFNSAMLLVPGNDAGDLFRAILRLSSMSPDFKELIPNVAAEWQDKLAQSPERDTLLPALDRLAGTSK